MLLLGVVEVDADEQQAFCRIPEVGALQVVDGPRQQPGPNQQRQRQRELQADQPSARAHLPPRAARAAGVFVEGRGSLRPRELPGWKHAEEKG